MPFQRFLNKLSSRIKVAGVSLVLTLSFTSASAATNLLRATQPVQNTPLEERQGILIAASSELDSLFANSVFSTPNVKELRGNFDYDSAYSAAWSWFNFITVDGTLRGPYWSPIAGFIYEADLIGGGRANIREGGSSGLIPTIDLIDHNSVGVNFFVREVKFTYLNE